MKRFFYISTDLDELEKVEADLESHGILHGNMHVVSNSDAQVNSKNLNGVSSLLRKDVIFAPLKGAIIGAIIAVAILLTSYLMDVSSTYWVLSIFAAIVAFGFCTWEGGMYGLHKDNKEFERFQKYIESGNHLFFVDVDDRSRPVLERTVAGYSRVQLMDVKSSAWVPAFSE